MSVQALSWVLEESEATGNDRLVLIVVANHTNRDDPWAFVKYETIALEARVHRATAIRCVNRLVESGQLEVRPSKGRACNEYRLVTPGPTVADCDGSVASQPSQSVAQPSQSELPTVALDPSNRRTGATQNREPYEPRTARGALTRRSRLPDDFTFTDSMRRWLAENGIPGDTAGAELASFKDYHAAKGSVGSDWEAAWRNWMRRVGTFSKPVVGIRSNAVTDTIGRLGRLAEGYRAAGQ